MARPASSSEPPRLASALERGAVEAAAQGGQAIGIPVPVGRILAKKALRHKKKVLLSVFLPTLLGLGGILVVFLAIAGVILQSFVITASSMASADVPKTYMAVAKSVGYHDGVPWPLLAAISSETTDFGHSNPYTGKTENTSFPTTTPPIGAGTTGLAASATIHGVGPMLLLPTAAAHVANPQTVRASMSYVGGQMLKIADHLARTQHKSEQTLYVEPLTKNQSFWGSVVGALPVANAGQCAPPGAVPPVGLTAATPTGGSQKTSAYTPSPLVVSNDIEYVFSCELAAATIRLATGPHTTIPSASADNELVAEALQISWAYSHDGTTARNCNPFPVPSGSSVPGCVVGAAGEEQQQVHVIEAVAKAVVAQAGTSLNSRTPTAWGVLPGIVVHQAHGTTPAPTGNAGTWPSAVPSSQQCQNAIFAELAPQSASNTTALAEPGPFSPAYPGAPKPKTGKVAYASAWATSPLNRLRTSRTCTPQMPTGVLGTPASQTAWDEIVAIAASEEYGQLEVESGSQASVSDLTGLVWYLNSVTKAPPPVAGSTTLVPRLASSIVAPLTTAVPYPAVPSVVGASGFAAQTVTLAEAYDKATASLVSLTTGGGGAIAGVPPGWLQWAQAAGQAECPGYPLMPYLVLAVANHESGFWTPGSTPSNPTDQDKTPVTDGADGVQYAEGPLQFLPPTFAEYAVPVNGAQPNILDPEDALFAAANMLCQDSHGGAAIDAALTVYGFNSPAAYTGTPCAHTIPINLYLSPGWPTSCALYYQMQSTLGGGVSSLPPGAVGKFLAAALSQVGHTYVFGAEDNPPNGTFDCSGLVDWAMLQAGGFGLRGLGGPGSHGLTTHAEWNLLSAHQVPQSALQPGDLLFYYGLDTTDPGVDHVGIYIGNGLMVDAADPTSGVLIQPYNYPGFYGATLP